MCMHVFEYIRIRAYLICIHGRMALMTVFMRRMQHAFINSFMYIIARSLRIIH